MPQSRRRLPMMAAVPAAVVLLATLAAGQSADPAPNAHSPVPASVTLPASAVLPAPTAVQPIGATAVFNPGSGRLESYEPRIGASAVLIGDSQSAGAAGIPCRQTWPMQALASLGYVPLFRGMGGTGFVTAHGPTGNYLDALRTGDWLLPHGDPALVLIQGGGNDAASGAGNAAIERNAALLIAEVRRTYPRTRIVLLGTLARSDPEGGNRRAEVDAVLSRAARSAGVPFISAGNWLSRYGAGGLLADRVHLSARGHRLFAGVLADRLSALGYAFDG